MDFLSRRSLLAAAAVSTLKAAPSGPTDEKSWREIAALYPVDRKILNFNHAGIGTSPRPVTDAYIKHVWSEEKAVPLTIFSYGPQLEPIRQGLATLFGADPEEIAITRNATESLNAILLGLPLKSGDEVLTTTLDYWAMLDALQQREQRDGVVVRKLKIPVPCEDLSQIVRIFEQAITAKTKLILVSHPINLNGQLFPIRDLSRMAHAKGIEVVVDAAQSFALAEYKLADLECDYLGTSLHKWLQAPKGSGMLYIKRDKIGKVWPLFASGGTRPKEDIRKFELYGTWSESILAIGDAIAFHNSLGSTAKEARHRYLTQRWVDAVKGTPGIRFHTAFGKTQSCGITCVEVEGLNSGALRKALLDKRGILTMDITRRTQEFKGIRISPSLANTIEEVDKLAEALRDARKLV
ncbi:isopenicillin-N epimerase [Bryobacterales bacterium F-183]|nr:isopenicillin-N epimerase [Bryobacterales bacterium F-183]